jgi:hypothetical protein
MRGRRSPCPLSLLCHEALPSFSFSFRLGLGLGPWALCIPARAFRLCYKDILVRTASSFMSIVICISLLGSLDGTGQASLSRYTLMLPRGVCVCVCERGSRTTDGFTKTAVVHRYL